MPPNPVRDLGFVLAFCLVIVGTALLWRDQANVVPDTREARSMYNWDVVVFFLVLIAAGAARFLNQPIFAIFAAGMLVSLAIYRNSNFVSWTSINLCRIAEGQSATQNKHSQLCTGGGVLAYAGVFLAAALAFVGAEKRKSQDTLLVVGAVATGVLAVIGVIVIWTSDAAASNNTDAYYLAVDTTVLTILATTYTVVGVIFEGVPLRSAAAFLSAMVFVSSFHDMFVSVLNTDANRPVYAGFLFCWFSMITNIAVAVKHFWEADTVVHSG
eukprot:m.15155 g.15155  ORF g.15155 m.15155 type:complete len:270 (-) comp6621_c0_seq1:224-1033(-)